MPNNIERFDEVVLGVLRVLHKSFPAAAYPNPMNTGLTDEKPVEKNGRQEASDDWKHLQTEISGVLQWLVDEGYVHDRGYKMGARHVISLKGLQALERLDSGCNAPRI